MACTSRLRDGAYVDDRTGNDELVLGDVGISRWDRLKVRLRRMG
jgi:hypothetical protein